MFTSSRLACWFNLALLVLAQQLEQHPLTAGSKSQPNSDFSNASLTELLSLHQKLVSIPSISGNEHDVAIFLREYLESQNLHVELQPVAAQDSHDKARYNVFAYPHRHRDTPLLLTSHIDTVPPYIPYSVKQDSEIWGRGSVDAKGSVATQIIAYLELVRAGQIKAEDASLLFVVGEETTGDGMLTANALGPHWKTVIFGEPSELKLVSGHKGILLFTIKAKGKEAHSGYPWLGKSAIEMILPALTKLLQMPLPSSEKYGNTTLNIGYIRGGEAANVVPAAAEARVSLRIAAGTPDSLKALILKAVHEVDAQLEVNFSQGYPPIDLDYDIPGFDSMTVNYGTDVPNQKGDNKRYLYGPGSIFVSHASQEHLTVDDLAKAVAGYKKIMLHVLQK